jgi:hypothetical protein
MRFVAHPAGAGGTNITGYAWEGPKHIGPGVYAGAAVRASEQYAWAPARKVRLLESCRSATAVRSQSICTYDRDVGTEALRSWMSPPLP